MPTARGELAAGVVNGILYAVGGYNTHDLNSVEAYDIAADTWTTKAPLPTAREGLAVAVVNGILYAIGGNARSGMPSVAGSLSMTSLVTGPPGFRSNLQSAEHPLATVEAYDPATNKWTTKASMPTPRSMLAVGVLNGIIYAIGGSGQISSSMRTVEAYDPVTDLWIRKADMPATGDASYGRAALGAAVLNGTLYAIGGFAVYQETNLVETYDPVSDRWTRALSMPTMRQSLGVAVIDGIVYAVGGACYDDTLNVLEAYTPL
jgi:N-acetylneuraminic acid mutarotase